MNNGWMFVFENEPEFRKKESALKKYNRLGFKKLINDYYPKFREGMFLGVVTATNKKEQSKDYVLKIPTDSLFARVHGEIKLLYTVYENDNKILFKTILPESILDEGHKMELSAYRGVLISKTNPDKDMFKVNLLNMLDK